jgi:hypothetical protein
MAEALAALGVASTIMQVVDFSAKVAKYSQEVITSGKDAISENQKLESLTREYSNLATAASDGHSLGTKLSAEDQAIERLAEECKAAAKELLDTLSDLRIPPNTRGAKRFFKGVLNATKTLAKQRELVQKKERVRDLTEQLTSACTLSLRRYAKQHGLQSEKMHTVVKQTEANVQHVAHEQLKHTMTLSSLDRGISDLDSRFSMKERQEAIEGMVKSVHFPELESRAAQIFHSYPETYEWVLHDENLGFRSWLETGNGKSTLMKFLSNHPTTEACLQCWAAGKRLSLLKFYFWYLGSTFEKSIEGLLRSLLYQLVTSEPRLMEEVFWYKLEQMAVVPSSKWSYEVLQDTVRFITTSNAWKWSYETLLDTLRFITTSKAWEADHGTKCCIFVDGLDEYRGDHWQVVQLLLEICSTGHIKICVSSRPWNVFQKAIATTPGFRLEELTRGDIDRYVRGTLVTEMTARTEGQSTSQTPELSPLVLDITNKAGGVFLWVYLVVKSVLSGFNEGDALPLLRQRVQAFPEDLDTFFDTILSRVENVYRKSTVQALQLANLYFTEDHEAWFIDFWFLKQCSGDLEDHDRLPRIQLSDCPHLDISSMCQETQRFLNACCKDLLYISTRTVESTAEVPDVPHSRRITTTGTKVQFLHRTVYEFLQTDEMQAKLNSGLPGYFHSGLVFELLARTELTYLSLPSQELFERFGPRTLRYRRDECGPTIALYNVLAPQAERSKVEPWSNPRAEDEYIEVFLIARVWKLMLPIVTGLAQSSTFLFQARRSREEKRLQNLLRATLGSSSLDKFAKFGIELIDIDFVHSLFQNIDSTGNVKVSTLLNLRSMDDAPPWHQFLDKWLTELLARPEHKAGVLDHGWILAKLMLERGAEAPSDTTSPGKLLDFTENVIQPKLRAWPESYS